MFEFIESTNRPRDSANVRSRPDAPSIRECSEIPGVTRTSQGTVSQSSVLRCCAVAREAKTPEARAATPRPRTEQPREMRGALHARFGVDVAAGQLLTDMLASSASACRLPRL